MGTLNIFFLGSYITAKFKDLCQYFREKMVFIMIAYTEGKGWEVKYA